MAAFELLSLQRSTDCVTGMKEDLDSAARYRERAEKLRTLAEATSDESARKGLLKVAEDYERMARSRERIDKSAGE